jgi:hypothetical protein
MPFELIGLLPDEDRVVSRKQLSSHDVRGDPLRDVPRFCRLVPETPNLGYIVIDRSFRRS